MRRYFFISIMAACGSCCFAQLPGGFAVRGQVEHEPSDRVDDLYVEVYEQDRHMLVEKVSVGFDGGFEFRQAGAGNYEVRLVDRSGNSIRTEYTCLIAGQPLTFRLPVKRPTTPRGPVSLATLRRHENRKAMREFERAVKDHEAGHAESSFAHLQNAIALDPTYAPAHNQLGLITALRGDEHGALLEFEKAVKLDPALAIPHCNLAIALLRAGRASEAEVEARKAVQLDPSYSKAQSVVRLCMRSNNPAGLKPAE